MYCPKCANKNAEAKKFCRSCGSNLSLVPQALTGRLPEAFFGQKATPPTANRRPGHIANGITKHSWVGFLLVSLVPSSSRLQAL